MFFLAPIQVGAVDREHNAASLYTDAERALSSAGSDSHIMSWHGVSEREANLQQIAEGAVK